MSKIDNINKLKDEKGVQFRDFTYETRADEQNYIVEGTPVVFDSETHLFNDGEYECYEVIDRKAFDDADMSDVIFNYNHSGRVFARTRNDTLSLSVEEDGLHMTAELWKDDPGHTELYKDISRGNIDKMSFAFTIASTEWVEDREAKTATRVITGIDRLYDVSAVDIPAYSDTQISARNELLAERQEVLSERHEAERLEKEIAERKAELIKQITETTGGQNGNETE